MLTRSISKLAIAAACGLAFTFAAPIAAPVPGFISAAHAQQPAQFQSILARYGSFQAHAKYGDVWIPAREVAPEGWHPYPPCNWVHTKDLGWYFNDKTEWGKIVHHYGRWAHDKDLGWVWVRGEEFSPGWVVWRTSDKWVGWAPMPPEQDIKEISATDFNNDKQWIFVDAKKFAASCDGGAIVSVAPSLYPVIMTETKVVTQIKFVGGIAIFVLPPPLLINIVDIDINIGVFPPWSPCFLGAWFWNWNWMVNIINVNINLPQPNCPHPLQQLQKPLMPIKSTPPAPPGQTSPPGQSTPPSLPPGRRADLPPTFQPPTYVPPVRIPPVRIPPVVINPGDGPKIRPIDPGFNRPVRPQRPIDPVIVKPKDPSGPGRTPNPNTGDSGGGKVGKGPTIDRPNRVFVPKLVRTPEIVTRHPGLGTVNRAATMVPKKPSSPNLR